MIFQIMVLMAGSATLASGLMAVVDRLEGRR